MLSPDKVEAIFAEVVPEPTPKPDDHAPPAFDHIPDSADGEPIFEPLNGAATVADSAEESDCLEEWDAGEITSLPPPREWLLGNQFCRKFVSGLTAPGATGKSATRLVQY